MSMGDYYGAVRHLEQLETAIEQSITANQLVVLSGE